MAKTLSYPVIVGILKQQQETVGIIDEYIQRILSDSNIKSNYHADLVMQHIFVNIRNSYQDSIFISQGLINNHPYYLSTALYHTQRVGQEFLIDLAYVMSDLKHKSGYEYLRYLKFLVGKETKESGKTLPEDIYNEIFPPDLDLEPKSPSQWSHTNPKGKIEQGLKLYKIELPHYAEGRAELHSRLSSAAHGNSNTDYMLRRTPEENLPKLRADLTSSIGFFDILLRSALECYIELYLGRNKDYREIIKSVFPNHYSQIRDFQIQIKDSYGK